MKMRFAMLVGPVCLLFLFACSDSTSIKRGVPGASSVIITPIGTLDQNIIQILALFPKGLETAATTRWGNIKSKYAAGLLDPTQMAVARQMAFELSDWVNKKAPDMDTPLNGETRISASARAVQYMLMYIYSGPTTPVPPYSPAADAIVGLVTPGAPATVVTPSGHAGVGLEAGSVAENTVIVISQNLTPFPAVCSGQLQTLLCQYPQFYTFEEFPHTKLLKSAKFSVCHVNNADDPRHPLADHDRFRLAHAKPANPADYTPGSTIRDQFGESIEILPLIHQTFVTCPLNGITYASADRSSDGLLTRLASGVMKALTPKSAYAIDQGLGGGSFFFSPFNDVDPDGRPDRAVQSLTVTPACGVECSVHPGTHVTVNFTVANIGTATTGDGAPGFIRLIQPAVEGPPVIVTSLGAFSTGPALAPGGSVVFSQDVLIPSTVPAGSYSVQVTSGIGFFPEVPTDLVNNTATAPISITVDLNQLITAANNDFAIAYYGNGVTGGLTEGQVNFSGLLADEFAHAETFATRLEIDRRSISADNASVRGVFRDIQRARARLDEVRRQVQAVALRTQAEAQLASFDAFADVLLAENWCSGVPTSFVNANGDVIYGGQMTTAQLLQFAIGKFDAAISVASELGEGAIATLNLARVGKARALLDMDDAAGAAAVSATVPTGFAYSVGANDTQNNGVYAFQNVGHRWTVSDHEGGNGLGYRVDGDPRVQFEAAGVGFDLTTPLFLQLKYPGAASPLPIAQGVEARLIEAEAFLRSGDLANFTLRINTVRAFYGLAVLPIPSGGADARAVLFRERAYALWLTSHRLGDLRRLVRQYDQGQSSVFPTGEYPKGGVYGSDVNFPIPVDATFNPTGLACFDRNP
ncbi:MAG: hypothetical protein ACXWMR_12620 [Gemmatimonadaceae bacterium]